MQNKIILNSIIFLLAFATLSTCRFKDNDNISLLSVKRRLGRTWLLKEAVLLDSNNLNLIAQKPWLMNDSLIISRFEKGNKIFWRTRHLKSGFLCELRDNKTKIFQTPPSPGEFYLTITRLTTKELWLQGNPILRLCDRPSSSEIMKLKYVAAD